MIKFGFGYVKIAGYRVVVRQFGQKTLIIVSLERFVVADVVDAQGRQLAVVGVADAAAAADERPSKAVWQVYELAMSLKSPQTMTG